MFRRRVLFLLGLATLIAGVAGPRFAHAERQVVWVTNSAGNDVHVIDVARQEVIKRFEVGPEPHGIAATRDFSNVFLSIENMKGEHGEILWVDPREYIIRHRLEIGPKPNQLACTPDGRFAYVPCDDGKYWVIDGQERRVVTTIHTGGRPHNTTCSPDGRWMYLSPMESPHKVTVVDVEAGHKVVGEIPFADAVRPPALSSDGKRLFQHIDNHLGFQVADTESRKVIATIADVIPTQFAGKPSRSHGLAIRPDQREIWSCNVEHQLLHVHDLTQDDMPEIATIPMIGKIYWLCFTPDSKFAYVSVRSERKTCVVDTATKTVLKHIDVGDTPKRNLVLTLPD